MAPAIRALWAAYRSRRSWAHEAGDRVERVVRLAGARLLLSAHEATESGAPLGAHILLHVQLAANLLSSPGEACAPLGLAGTA